MSAKVFDKEWGIEMSLPSRRYHRVWCQ